MGLFRRNSDSTSHSQEVEAPLAGFSPEAWDRLTAMADRMPAASEGPGAFRRMQLSKLALEGCTRATPGQVQAAEVEAMTLLHDTGEYTVISLSESLLQK
jgi:hypothetical protein